MNSKNKLRTLFDYDFLDEPPLGSGSYGTVYSVYHKQYKNCAAKCISKKIMAERGLNEHLRNETTIHKKLKHKNIVNFLDQFQTITEVFIILEKCNSETLEKICQNFKNIFKKQMSIKLIQHFLLQISNAVHFMHSKGIAHRDLKLDNIMLYFEDELPLDDGNNTKYFYYNREFIKSPESFENIMLTSVVKIIDLGFAKELDSKGCAKSFLGTPAYLAPEVLKKKTSEFPKDFSYSSKVDTWALGVITFELLTRDTPFDLSKVKTFNELYKLHKEGSYLIREDFEVSLEFLDYLNGQLQFDEYGRINIDDLIQHPFLTKNVEDQKVTRIQKLIQDGSNFLSLKTSVRKNFLGSGDSFGYGKGDIERKFDENLFKNDKILDDIFDVHTSIRIYEREVDDGYLLITVEKLK